MKSRYLFSLIVIISFSLVSKAQQTGIPYITNFAPEVYKAASQNWAVVQDKRGVLFFGNGDGVLEYDGISWRIIKTPSTVRSLAMDTTGRIYVGIRRDFGYLQPDSLGDYQYKSLKENIPLQAHEFNDIWDIYVCGNQIFFQSTEKIFVLQNNKFKVIHSKESFHSSFLVNNTFYAREKGNGLLIYENDSLQLVEGGERFANEGIFEILPYKQNELLIVTSTQGLWIYAPNENKFYKPTGFEAVDKFLLQHLVYCGTIFKNGSVALGTITGGIIVFNKEGNIQNIYNTHSGLRDNGICCLYCDNNQQLWAALENGISLVQTNQPFQCFTEKNGLKGKPMCINVFNNHLYVGTSQYLCVQNSDGNFETIAGTEGQNWQLYKINETLLLAHLNGLFEIKEKQAIPLIKSTGFLNLCPINNKPDFLLASLAGNGLCLLEYSQKTWKIKTRTQGFTKIVYKIVQDKEGYIWVYNSPELYRLRLNATMDSVISVIQYTAQQGLPTSFAKPYLLNSGEVVFGTEKGIYRYISATNTFEVHPDFNMLTGKISEFQQQKNGDIWFQEITGTGIYETGVLNYINGKYQLFKQPFYKFNDYAVGGTCNFYVYSDSAVFIGINKGLLQYNPLQKVDYNIPYHTLIRKVLAKDSLLFGGATLNLLEFENLKRNVIPYSQNNLVFHYAATFYEDAEKNLYSYRLIGSDTTWSAWVSDVKKEYTNLYEGEYTFEVRAKNQYKVIGSTASYSFRIIPPWQRTWWAYSLYLILLALIIFIIVKLYTRLLREQKVQLELTVKEKTAKVVNQQEELQAFNQELLTTNEDLYNQREELEVTLQKLKETQKQLFQSEKMASLGLLAAGVAHEINNPLNFIQGGVTGIEQCLKENLDENKSNVEFFINAIQEGVKRAVEIVSGLNHFSRTGAIISDKIDIHAIIDNCLLILQNITKYRIEILKKYSNKPYTLVGNEGKLHQAIMNIIANAVQAIDDDNGIVTINTEIEERKIKISVTDNGCGISEENLTKILDPFFTTKDPGKGTGLGLSITYNILQEHDGTIGFESELGKGTTVIITLPIKNPIDG